VSNTQQAQLALGRSLAPGTGTGRGSLALRQSRNSSPTATQDTEVLYLRCLKKLWGALGLFGQRPLGLHVCASSQKGAASTGNTTGELNTPTGNTAGLDLSCNQLGRNVYNKVTARAFTLNCLGRAGPAQLLTVHVPYHHRLHWGVPGAEGLHSPASHWPRLLCNCSVLHASAAPSRMSSAFVPVHTC